VDSHAGTLDEFHLGDGKQAVSIQNDAVGLAEPAVRLDPQRTHYEIVSDPDLAVVSELCLAVEEGPGQAVSLADRSTVVNTGSPLNGVKDHATSVGENPITQD
jgi:hypothetical protein